MNCSLPGSSVHGILQARYWSGLPCPPPGDLLDLGTEPTSLTSHAWQSGSLPLAPPGEAPVTLIPLFFSHMPAPLGPEGVFVCTLSMKS